MLKFKFGWLKDPEDSRDFTRKHDLVKPFLLKCAAFGDVAPTLPKKYSIENAVEMPRIENQKNLGSCTAHAGTTMYEIYAKFLKKKDSKIKFEELSRLFLYKTTRNLLGWKGDTGAYLRTVMKALNKYGAPPETAYPYIVEKFDNEPGKDVYTLAEKYQALVYYKLDDINKDKMINSIKLNLAANRACVIGFTVFSNLSNKAEVPFPGAGDSEQGGHAVPLVGFDDGKVIGNYIGAFRFGNSWDRTWGDKGYGWLPYQYISKNLASDCWTMMSGEWAGERCFNEIQR